MIEKFSRRDVITVAQRTIYISDDFGPIWDRAKALAGETSSLSAVVMDSLRRFVETQEALKKNYHVIELDTQTFTRDGRKVGEHKIRFVGRPIVVTTYEDELMESEGMVVYLTLKGRWVFYWPSTKRLLHFPNLTEASLATMPNGEPMIDPNELVQLTASETLSDWVEEIE